jgi:hypothetical protein
VEQQLDALYETLKELRTYRMAAAYEYPPELSERMNQQFEPLKQMNIEWQYVQISKRQRRDAAETISPHGEGYRSFCFFMDQSSATINRMIPASPHSLCLIAELTLALRGSVGPKADGSATWPLSRRAVNRGSAKSHRFRVPRTRPNGGSQDLAGIEPATFRLEASGTQSRGNRPKNRLPFCEPTSVLATKLTCL